MPEKKIDLIGAGLGWGAGRYETAWGPEVVLQSGLLQNLQKKYQISWQSLAATEQKPSEKALDYQQRLAIISQFNHELAILTQISIQKENFPLVIGGDHSIAVGTWSGVVTALKAHQAFGLIWFDAHMDSHTPETTPSGNIHGMPLAALLGYGEKQLVNLKSEKAKLNPLHTVLIGVRSYEKEEAALLKKLNVKVYFMEEVRNRGLDAVFAEALQIVTKGTKGFGISLDIDVFDPEIAMGTGTLAENGLFEDEVCAALNVAAQHPLFRAMEIAEFNPQRDVDNKTMQLMQNVMMSALPDLEKKYANH